jgi:hypothetical protein
MSRPCTCERIHDDPTAAYTPDQCRLCWLFHFDPDYRAAWGGAAHDRCKHRGDEARRRRCSICRGTVELRVFACSLHRECTLGTQLPGIACCAVCPDYEAFE